MSSSGSGSNYFASLGSQWTEHVILHTYVQGEEVRFVGDTPAEERQAEGPHNINLFTMVDQEGRPSLKWSSTNTRFRALSD